MSAAMGLKVTCLAACLAFFGCTTQAQNTEQPVPNEDSKPAAEKIATLAGGCFWCTEAVFERMKGVNDVVSGYTGDETKPNPTYQQICDKTTNHAEAIQIYYDPSVVNYSDLLEVFFHVHDPTTPNRQGADVGPQYRSAIFYHDDQQKADAEAMIKKLTEEHEFRAPIVTEVTKLGTWYNAEEYHQDYFRRNPYQGYCQAVVATKVKKFRNLFKDQVRSDGVGSRREK